jgi:PiT family inorganic phosphate transporter
MGAGATRRVSAVRWGVTRNIFWAWLLTIPVSAMIGAILFYLLSIYKF